MWMDLPSREKSEYKRMILAFASLTEMFAQKADKEDQVPVPILNSKYQETVFQKVFHAYAEDIGNTSYDASIKGKDKKYLIGLKTFGYSSKEQKIAQFKANHDEWTDIFETIKKNSTNPDGTRKTKEEINEINKLLYLKLAKRISYLRNKRIESSKANLQGFQVSDEKEIESVYHVLMPACINNSPSIAVGEISYDLINIDDIEILGCSSPNNPANFSFYDKNHYYRFTAADSQLLMNFQNQDIVLESWSVKYAEDAYSFFADIADKLYKTDEIAINSDDIEESYCWSILNKNGEVEQFSGFNGFNGVGSKLAKDKRKDRIEQIEDTYSDTIEEPTMDYVTEALNEFLFDYSGDRESKQKKVSLRNTLIEVARETGNEYFFQDISKTVFRPVNEMYIPIPNSRKFHLLHPDFFVKNGFEFNSTGGIKSQKEYRQFNLVFEPSGNTINSFIAEDWGKAIESSDSMGILGEWILRKVFQLDEYEPLTAEKLNEVGINGIRLYKVKGSKDVHLKFIWIDEDSIPDDYWS